MRFNLLHYFQPKNKLFFELFQKGTLNLIEISSALVELVNTANNERRKELFKEIEDLEHVGDSITHETFKELSSNFITPFDREDIHALTSAIDDIADFIYGTSKRIKLYNVSEMTETMVKLADLIHSSTKELHIAITELKDLKNAALIREACVKINSIENHADDLFELAIALLFDNEKDAVEIIKNKEVLQGLETATDKCEDAANIIESILIKNA